MNNYLIGKYNIEKDDVNKKLILTENIEDNEKEPDVIEIDISNVNEDELIDYSVSAFEMLTEGSLNNKIVMYSDCNYASSEVILDNLPYESIEYVKDYLRLVVKKDGEPLTIFLDIKTLCNNNEYN